MRDEPPAAKATAERFMRLFPRFFSIDVRRGGGGDIEVVTEFSFGEKTLECPTGLVYIYINKMMRK